MKIGSVVFNILILIAISACPSLAAEADISGVWEAKVYGSRIEAQVAQDGQSIVGVVYVEETGGKVSPYHIIGTVVDGQIQARHHSGHVFEGQALSKDEVAGILTTKGGYRVSVQATRHPGPTKLAPPEPWFSQSQSAPKQEQDSGKTNGK